jgi:hypothetical protein
MLTKSMIVADRGWGRDVAALCRLSFAGQRARP